MKEKAPIETKVTTATLATAVAGFVVGWIVLEVPALEGAAEPLQGAIVGVVTSVFTFVGGWLAKHTPRSRFE